MTDHRSKPAVLEQLAQARTLRQAGRYAEALELLAVSEEWPAPENESGTALRAAILARIRPVDALALLARTQDLFQTDAGKFGYYLASIRAYGGTNNFEAAADMAERAATFEQSVSLANRCLLWYHRCQIRHATEQYDVNDPDITALIASGDANGAFLGLMLRSYMHNGVGNYAAQTTDLIAALDVAVSHPGACDPGIVAIQVHALLRLGLEMANHAAIAAATDAYEWMPWSDDLRNERFLCVRALAWDAFLRGESAQAQWLLKDSKAFAASNAWRLMAHLDRAYIARMSGNEPWVAEELASAHGIARTVEWGETHGEERAALVMLAVLFSPTDMALAQHYVSLYTRLGQANVDPLLTLAKDLREPAFERYAQGRVQQVLGNDDLAVKAFSASYEFFDKAGYHFRASLAAMGMFETNRDAKWLERARSHADFFPRSALRATLAQENIVSESSRLLDLTPMQRQIAYALCEGLDLAQLSQRFSRSAFTLGRHVDIVYSRLGVNNPKALRTAVQAWTIV